MPCTKNMTGCHRACQHRQLVESYRLARITWEQKLEDATCGWATEGQEFREQNPPPTFGDWLRQTGGGVAA